MKDNAPRAKNDPEYSASIMEIKSGLYLTEDENGNINLGEENERLIFYDEAEAEAYLLMLNEENEGCYTLINEAVIQHQTTAAPEETEAQGMNFSMHL